MPGALFALAAQEGILVRYADLPADILGAYYRRTPDTVILLHTKLRSNRRLNRCILAEELGHHFTTGRNVVAFARAGKYHTQKIERLAAWWATQCLVPFSLLSMAVLRGARTTFELAEHFDVTERFMAACLRLYREKRTKDMDGLIMTARLVPEDLL